MSEKIIHKFSSSVLAGTGKKGIIKPTSEGYYPVTLGAFDAYNEAGILYPFNEYLVRTLSSNSDFMRRVRGGNLRGESEHPEFKPGMRMPEYLNRLRQIRMDNVCCHFGDIIVLEATDHVGRKIMRIDGLVKPSGPNGQSLKESLENPKEDTCFSVRSIVSQRVTLSGDVTNNIKTLVTWDNVNEPGVRIARKYSSPGLESFDGELEITPELLHDAERLVPAAVGMESGFEISTTMIRSDLGWEKVELVKPTFLDY